MSRVETIKAQARRRHLVEDRGLDIGMPVVARLLPAVVVAHHEDQVGAWFTGVEEDRKKQEDVEERFHPGEFLNSFLNGGSSHSTKILLRHVIESMLNGDLG